MAISLGILTQHFQTNPHSCSTAVPAKLRCLSGSACPSRGKPASKSLGLAVPMRAIPRRGFTRDASAAARDDASVRQSERWKNCPGIVSRSI